jgi:hypothetical protein
MLAMVPYLSPLAEALPAPAEGPDESRVEWHSVGDDGGMIGFAPARRDTSPDTSANPDWKRGYNFGDEGGKVYGEQVDFHCFEHGVEMLLDEILEAREDMCETLLRETARDVTEVDGWWMYKRPTFADTLRKQVALKLEM